MQEMTRVPAWMPELPLQAEIGVGSDYGEVRFSFRGLGKPVLVRFANSARDKQMFGAK